MTRHGNGQRELRDARAAGRGLLVAAFGFSVFVNLLMLTGPLFMLQIYDRVLGSGSEETLVSLTLLVVALYALMGALDFARGRVLARFGARFQARLDPRVFEAEFRRVANAGQDAPVANGLRDMATIQSLFASPAMLALFDLPWTPLFVAAIFLFHPALGWLAVAGGSVLIAAAIANSLLTRSRLGAAQARASAAQGFSDEVRRGIETVSAQGMTGAVAERWRDMRIEALRLSVRASDWQGFFSSFSRSFRLLLQSAVLALGAWLVLRGQLTPGAIIAGSVMLGRALAPVEQSIGQWPLLQQSIAGWRALGHLLSTAPSRPEVTPLPRPAAHLRLSGVAVMSGGTQRPALAGITLDVPPGSVLGVIGRSGSGKTTLARAMLGLLPPVQGEVRLGGATLTQYAPEALGALVGYLPQQVTLFSGTVEANIARMTTGYAPEDVVAAARMARAHDLILQLPQGYGTVIDAGDIRLSGGQMQRIGLARALFGDPVLLVLDEPNSALDHEGSEALNQAVRAFRAADRAVVLMTHRPNAIQECDRLAVIDGGRITAQGPREDILRAMLQNAGEVSRTAQGGAPAPAPPPPHGLQPGAMATSAQAPQGRA